MKNVFDIISVSIIPLMIGIILLFALIKKVPVFDTFLEGAKEGLCVVIKITPPIIGLLVAVSMLNASGVWDILSGVLTPISKYCNFPADLLPLGMLRSISGSGALAILKDVFDRFGVDSFIAFAASIMMGNSETTFYTIAVYFGSVGIKKSRWTLPAALLSDLCAFILAIIIAKFMY